MTVAAIAPYFFQVAYVVPDLEAAEKWFKQIWSVPSFLRMENLAFPESSTYRGKPSSSSMSLSLGYAGETQIELIQPLTGPSLYTDFLGQKGAGLHHVAFAVPHFNQTIADLKANGLQLLIEGHLESGTDFAYFDCEVAGASVIEILGFTPETWEFMNQLKNSSITEVRSPQ